MKLFAARRRTPEPAVDERAYNLTLSVLVVTYNHERFLAHALEQALAQKTRFLYEIVVGDDCSTDATHQIALDYQARFPHRIRIERSETNLGATGNFLATLAACRGKYVAMLEGDDYWTDHNKLQRQVDLLEADPTLSACFHNVHLHQDGHIVPFANAPYPKPRIGLAEMIRQNLICNCSTVVFRNRIADRLPRWLARSAYYDWPLHVHNAAQGDIGYIADVMSVYRIHDSSAWHGADRVERTEAVVWLLERLQEDLAGRHEREFSQTLGEWRAMLAAEKAAMTVKAAEDAAPRVVRPSFGERVKRRLGLKAA